MWGSAPSNKMAVSLPPILCPKTPDQLCGPLSLLFKGTQLLSATIKHPGHKLTTHLHLVLWLRISGDVSPPAYHHSMHGNNSLSLSYFIMMMVVGVVVVVVVASKEGLQLNVTSKSQWGPHTAIYTQFRLFAFDKEN